MTCGHVPSNQSSAPQYRAIRARVTARAVERRGRARVGFMASSACVARRNTVWRRNETVVAPVLNRPTERSSASGTPARGSGAVASVQATIANARARSATAGEARPR